MKAFSLVSTFRAAVFGLATVVAGSAALAQAPAPAPAAPAVAPAASEPSDAHIKLAIEVVKLSGMSRSIDLIVPQMIDKARQLFTQMRPEIAGELEKSIKTLQPDFDTQKQLALQIAARSFALRLTEPELTDLRTFFNSATGMKFVANQPVILQEMFRGLDGFSQQLSQFVVDKLREDMKKKGIPF